MGLSFTNIEDRNGAAVYFISDGLTTTTERLTLIANEIAARNPETQLVLLDNPEEVMGNGLPIFMISSPSRQSLS